MSTILFIIAAWLWFVLVMQDGERGSIRIALILPTVLLLGLAFLLVEYAAKNLRKLIEWTSASIIQIGKDD